MKKFPVILFLILMIGNYYNINAQGNGIQVSQLNGSAAVNIDNQIRPITTAVPFLNITPDSRASAMGDVGVATSPDANSTYWNPAKLAFMDSKTKFGGSVAYNPWLRYLVPDMSLSYLTGFYRLRKEDVVAVSMTYFDLGSIQFTDINGQTLQDFNPREFAFTGTYSRQLGKGFSAGLSAKYVYSNLTGNITNSSDLQGKPGSTGAADLGFYWNRDLYVQGYKFNLALGSNISNVGGKISYTNSDAADFIPTNLRLGYALTYEIDEYNKITWATDFNKLMVPSPQIAYQKSVKNPSQDTVSTTTGNKIPLGFYNVSQKSLLSGMFGSFTDAPGGLTAELQEVMWSSGLEYWYNNVFAVRGGYFHESYYTGDRQYFGIGFGIKYQVMGFDFAYTIPTTQNSPLANTLRFALNFNFAKKEKTKEESVVE